MNIVTVPFWKKWLSYFIEYELEQLESEHGHPLSLCLSDGKFQLNAHKAIYSWEDKYDNFYKAFAQIKWESFPCSEVLSLGFGLGSIVQMLEQNFKKSFYYTGVELDDQIIYLAEKYILHRLDSSIQIIQAPAEIFVQTSSETYDLITVDVFINDKIPHAIKNYDFLQHCKDRLSQQGLLLMNHLADKESEVKNAKLFFNKVFKKVFPESYLMDVNGNYIFFSHRNYVK